MEKLTGLRKHALKKQNLESYRVSLLVSPSGEKSTDDHIEREQCSRVHLDAITSDDDGSVYAFRGKFPIVILSRQEQGILVTLFQVTLLHQ